MTHTVGCRIAHNTLDNQVWVLDVFHGAYVAVISQSLFYTPLASTKHPQQSCPSGICASPPEGCNQLQTKEVNLRELVGFLIKKTEPQRETIKDLQTTAVFVSLTPSQIYNILHYSPNPLLK